MKFLGIDWGEKRIGLAIGDDEMKIATPFGVVVSSDDVLRIIREEEIQCIVYGEPKTMRNESGSNVRDSQIFLKKITDKLDIPVIAVDERLSSRGADALVGDKKTKAPRDALAAMIILQGYLDRI